MLKGYSTGRATQRLVSQVSQQSTSTFFASLEMEKEDHLQLRQDSSCLTKKLLGYLLM